MSNSQKKMLDTTESGNKQDVLLDTETLDVSSSNEYLDINDKSSQTIRFPRDLTVPKNGIPVNNHQSIEEKSEVEDSPDTNSDTDVLSHAQAVGMQLGEDEEHPKEVDIARDVDAAEKAHHDE